MTATPERTVTFSHDERGRLTAPDGITRTQSFDGLQRHKSIQVSNQAGQTLMDYAYTWDDTGNITEKATEHGDYLYAYDDIDRLVGATELLTDQPYLGRHGPYSGTCEWVVRDTPYFLVYRLSE